MEWPVLQAVLWESFSQLLLASNRRNMYMTLRNDTACAAFCGRSPRYCTRAEKWRKQRLWIQIPVLSHLHFVSTVFITRLQLYGTSNEIWLQEKNPFYQQWNLTPGEKSLLPAMKSDSRRKIPCHTRESNPHQYFAWLFNRTLNPLSYSPPTPKGN